MKTLYEAANALEAQMLLDLLKQEGLNAEIHGAQLQGAVGGLPAAGLVRLVIAEENYPAAREIVERWDREQPSEPIVTVQKPVPRPLKMVLIGAAVGIVITYAFNRAPVSTSGIDHNSDGVLDEKWIYAASGTLVKYEVDRNFDKKIDMTIEYDRRGAALRGKSDDNFDGVFETSTRYEFNWPVKSEVDTNDDGVPDLIVNYTFGVVTSNEILNITTGLPLRVEHFNLGVLTHADVDSDKDGKLDKRLFYNRLGELQRTEAITQ